MSLDRDASHEALADVAEAIVKSSKNNEDLIWLGCSLLAMAEKVLCVPLGPKGTAKMLYQAADKFAVQEKGPD